MSDDTYSVSELGAEPDEFFESNRVMTIKRGGLVFTWEGGEYIDVKLEDAEYAHDCINTSQRDGSFPEFSQESMRREIAEWEEG